jgi:hypothetical protein
VNNAIPWVTIVPAAGALRATRVLHHLSWSCWQGGVLRMLQSHTVLPCFLQPDRPHGGPRRDRLPGPHRRVSPRPLGRQLCMGGCYWAACWLAPWHWQTAPLLLLHPRSCPSAGPLSSLAAALQGSKWISSDDPALLAAATSTSTMTPARAPSPTRSCARCVEPPAPNPAQSPVPDAQFASLFSPLSPCLVPLHSELTGKLQRGSRGQHLITH